MATNIPEIIKDMKFPCKLLRIVLKEYNENHGENWCLDILTDKSKLKFVTNLKHALKKLEKRGELDGSYEVIYKVINFENRDYYNGYVTSSKMASENVSDFSGHKNVYKFLVITSNEMLPFQAYLYHYRDHYGDEAKPIKSSREIVQVVTDDGDVFYDNLTIDKFDLAFRRKHNIFF